MSRQVVAGCREWFREPAIQANEWAGTRHPGLLIAPCIVPLDPAVILPLLAAAILLIALALPFLAPALGVLAILSLAALLFGALPFLKGPGIVSHVARRAVLSWNRNTDE